MELKTLTSLTNPRVLYASKLARSASLRRKEGRTLLESRKVVEEAFRNRLPVDCVFVSQEFASSYSSWLREWVSEGITVYAVPDSLLMKMSALDTPEGILAVCQLKPLALEDLSPTGWGVILDGIQDPGNAGAIARAALAFGADFIVFTKGSVDPLHPRTIRGSMGALLTLPFAAADTNRVIQWVEQTGYRLIGTHPRKGIRPADADFHEPFLVALGSEGQGISRALEQVVHFRICIQTKRVESLPVVVAAGILFYEIAHKRLHQGPS